MKAFLKIWIVVCIGIFSWCKPLFAQEIIWERALHQEVESFQSICKSNDEQILAGGSESKFGFTHSNLGDFDGSALVKFSNDGDSLWIKKMPYLGSIKNLCPTENGLIWAAFQVRQPNIFGNDWMFFPAIALLANDSAILVKKSFPELNTFQLGDSYLTNDGGLILFGSRSPSFIPGFGSDFYALKVDALGQLQWSRSYNPGPTNSFCQGSHVEPMANGNFLVSGSMGRRIVSFEIDPETGNDTNFVQWYQTPSNFIIDFPSTSQAMANHVVNQGTTRSTSPKFFLGYFDYELKTKVWGGEQPGGNSIITPKPNSDGSFIFNYGTSTQDVRVQRMRADSTIVWSINNANTSIPGFKNFRALLYNDDESGILVGRVVSSIQGHSDDFYIAKFSGIGEPFDPTGIKQPHLVKTDAVPFPNPASTSFRFKKEFQKGGVYLFSITGKRVLSQPNLLPKGVIDVSGLAAGTYLYRAVLDGKPHWGKIIKQ